MEALPDGGAGPVEPFPQTFTETLVVTATRSPRPQGEVPSTVYVLPREELVRSPGQTLDAVARTVPSVATFRRSSSLVADPTSQGVNLRAVGPSGVSRALVLLDGAPLSDAFGGWVYWRSIPKLELERVEVAPGPSSALYGSSALGGVLQLITRRPERTGVEGTVSLGTLAWEAAARATWASSRGGVSVDAEHLDVSGYPVVPEGQAGAIDGPAFGRSTALAAHLDWRWDRLRLRSRAGFFDQAQNGGTTFTAAQVRTFELSSQLEAEVGGGHGLAGSLLLRWGGFEQQRARTGPDRDSETLAAAQEVPTRELGAAFSWVSPPLEALGSHRLSSGVDLRSVHGASLEALVPFDDDPGALVRREAGGDQLFGGAHLQDEWSLAEPLLLVGSLRFDVWSNFSARRLLRTRGGTETLAQFDPRTEAALSPRLGLRYRPLPQLTLRASGGSAFRAPTLNELYRPFQVGTVRTAANEALGPERLWGVDVGVEAAPLRELTLRLTGFWNRLKDPVTNVTLEAPLPDGSQRQRQNLGAATIFGLEAWADLRPLPGLGFTAAYTLSDAQVTSAPGRPELVGRWLPQAPVHRGLAAATFDRREWLAATVQARFVGEQFEDDLNERPLPGYAVVDVSLSRELGGGVSLFAVVENLFDRRYLTGRAGVDTLGAPRSFRAGVRLSEQPNRASGAPLR